MKYIIFDIDNCISDDGWRLKYIKDGFDKYHKLSSEDAFVPHPDLNTKSTIILTGRPLKYSKQTIAWLEKHGVEFEYILFRPNGNTEQASVLKKNNIKRIIAKLGIKKDDIVIAHDDCPAVLEAYNSLGIKTQLTFINPKEECCGHNKSVNRDD